ncbi:MAG TPA: filamentous hemagglutinin N-terminal domain-containing protein, partial [Cyanophyceae cyanobacterium]
MSVLSGNYVLAQITPDATLGAEPSIVTPNININGANADRIDGGAIRGANLFHSFLEFNVEDGQRVYFANPTGIDNILSRVTGNDPSDILGTLGVEGGANLFLINPNGIIFGANASLSLNGSFVASTANSLIFADGTVFSANVPQATPLLSVNVPIGLQFGANPGNIQVQGTGHNVTILPSRPTPSGLQVKSGNTLALVGGNLLLDGGIVTVPDGRIELGSVTAEGVVSFTPTSNGWIFGYQNVPSFGDIIVSKRALVDGSGVLHIPELRGAAVRSSDIQLTGRRVQLSGGSQIAAVNTATTQGGAVIIHATESVEVIGNTELRPNTSIFVNTPVGSKGDAGNIQITTGRLLLQNRGIVEASSSGTGRAGDITIIAKQVDVVGRHPQDRRRVSSLNTDAENQGSAGNITITAEQVRVQMGGRIAANASVSADGGNITIDTTELMVADDGSRIEAVVVGNRYDNTTGLTSPFDTPIGKGGNITIRAKDSVVLNDRIYFPGRPSGLLVRSQGTGDAGNLWIETQRLTVEGGALIEASTRFVGDGGGSGGKVIVNASESVELIGRSDLTQEPSILTADSLGTGQAGDLEINTGRLIVRDSAQVTVSGEGTGDAGILRVNADAIVLDNQGKLTGTTASGKGGDITLQVRDFISMRNGSAIATTAQNNGDGGNISINSPFIVALPEENSDIIANANQGFGGRIDINSTNIFGLEFRDKLTRLSDINASSNATGKDGTVQINTLDIDPSRGLTNLPTDFSDA